jgi:hypothetical protein
MPRLILHPVFSIDSGIRRNDEFKYWVAGVIIPTQGAISLVALSADDRNQVNGRSESPRINSRHLPKSIEMGFYDKYLFRQYGFYRPYVEQVIYRYLDCGDLHNGFARAK